MIAKKATRLKSRHPTNVSNDLDDAALERILEAVGRKYVPEDLDRGELRFELERLPALYATHRILRTRAEKKYRQLDQILNAATRLNDLLSGEAWLLVLDRMSIDDSDPHGALRWLSEVVHHVDVGGVFQLHRLRCPAPAAVEQPDGGRDPRTAGLRLVVHHLAQHRDRFLGALFGEIGDVPEPERLQRPMKVHQATSRPSTRSQSAATSRVCGMTRSRAFAVLRLMTSSYLVSA